MRAEDKALEGPELEHLAEAETRKQDELPVLAGSEVQDLELDHRGRLFDALQLILAGEQLTVSLLQLPQREAHALEFLQTAVTGREVHQGSFVYAEDRRAMLEQALAVLQQNLTHGSAAELAELHAKFAGLSTRVAELRDQLVELEDAQDELVDRHPAPVKAEDTDDDDDDDDGADAPDAAAAAPDAAPAPPVDEPEPDDSLTGFIASALHALATVGAETRPASRTVRAVPASSLSDGPEVVELPRPPSSLSDPEDNPGSRG
jgi:hypothetical protein